MTLEHNSHTPISNELSPVPTSPRFKKSWIFLLHPLLLSIYVPLFAFARNFRQVQAYELVVPLLIFLGIGFLFYGFFKMLIGNWQKSAAISFVALVFAFFYGFLVSAETMNFLAPFINVFALIFAIIILFLLRLVFKKRKEIYANFKAIQFSNRDRFSIFGILIALIGIMSFLALNEYIHSFHILPLSIWLFFAFFCVGSLYIIRLNANLEKFYSDMNRIIFGYLVIVLTFLVAVPLMYSLVTYNPEIITVDSNLISSVSPDELPDIYYFIPDEYAGKETLQTMYNFDNADFLGFLEDKNFYMTKNSVSNYNKTHLSVPSSLNMNFIEDLIEIDNRQAGDAILEELAKDNLVVKTLKANHYTYINVGSRWSLTGKNPNADISYSYEGLSHFNELLIESTILRARNSPAQVFDFESLKEIPSIDKSPKFVFAHMPVPHVPFIYDKDGNILPAEDWYDFNNYFGQLLFVNTQLKEVVNEILEKSTRPVVIIIQSDHGMRYCDRVTSPKSDCAQVNGYNNLNAYYFSDGDYSTLYETITPVNSFRVVFNKYLNTNYTLLEDKSDFTQIKIDSE